MEVQSPPPQPLRTTARSLSGMTLADTDSSDLGSLISPLVMSKLPPLSYCRCVVAPAFLLLLSCSATLGQSVNLLMDLIGEASSIRRDSEHQVWATDGVSTANPRRWRTAAINPSQNIHWIEWDLGQSVTVDRFRFWSGTDTPATVYANPPGDFELQGWDGTQWQTLRSWSGVTNPVFDDSFAPLDAPRRIRFYMTSGGSLNSDGAFQVFFEIELYGMVNPVAVVSSFPQNDGFLIEPEDDLTLEFSEPLQPVDLSGIQILDLTTMVPVGNVSASLAGTTLTITHDALIRERSYRLMVPAGAVALASQPSESNSPEILDFTVATSAPVILAIDREMEHPSDPIQVTFDRSVTLVSDTLIELWDTTADQVVPLTGVSVTGNIVDIAHGGLLSDNVYRLVLAPGAFTGNSNGVASPESRSAVLAGKTLIFETSFDAGLGDMQTGMTAGTTRGSSAAWKYSRTEGTSLDPSDIKIALTKSTNDPLDFLALPMVDLIAGGSYSIALDMNTPSGEPLGFFQNDSYNITTAELLLGWNKSGRNSGSWISDRTGPTVLLFHWTEFNYAYASARLDNIQLVRNFPPVLEVNAPIDGAVFREGDTIIFDIDAFGISGDVKRLTITDGLVDQEAVILDQDSSRVVLDWPYDTPGSRTINIVLQDDRGEITHTTVDLTIQFEDGSLGPFLQWDFDDDDPQGVTTDGQIDNQRLRTSSASYLSTPSVFLFAGETYTFQWDLVTEEGDTWGVQLTNEPGLPENPDPIQIFNFDTGGNGRYSTTFSVPADGPYHVTLFSADLTTSRNNFDNLRLIGNFNSAPLVTLVSQGDGEAIRTVAGSSLTIEATASDSDGTVTAMEFRNGNIVLGTVDTPDPDGVFRFVWENIPMGSHQVYARAIDSNAGYGDSVRIQLQAEQDFLRISTFLGSSGLDDRILANAFQSNGNLLLAGVLDPATLPGNPPVTYLNNTAPGDTGTLLFLDEDGRSIQKAVVVAAEVIADLALDESDRIYLALGSHGAAVLDASGSTVLNAVSAPFNGLEPGSGVVHRIDASPSGTHAILISSTTDLFDNPTHAFTRVYDASFNLLGDIGRIGSFVLDIAVDEVGQRIFQVGYKNITTDANPVDIPTFFARSFAPATFGDLVFRGYDWGGNPGVPPQPGDYRIGTVPFSTRYPSWAVFGYQIGEHSTNPAPTPADLLSLAPDADQFLYLGTGTSFLAAYTQWYGVYDRWLNRNQNNMADTRGERVRIAHGAVYATFEFDGGNTPLRWSTTDLDTVAPVVQGTDDYDSLFNTSTVPKTFIARYDMSGQFHSGTWITNRLKSGLDNTIRAANGDFAVGDDGWVHLVGGSAWGLPLTIDHLPGEYRGGAYYVVYAPDFSSRELVARVSANGTGHAIAVSPSGLVAMAGETGANALFLRNPLQTAYSEGSGASDGFFAVGDFDRYHKFQMGEHPRLFFGAEDLPELRDRITREPYASMYQRLKDMLVEQDALENESEIYRLSYRAMIYGFLYQMEGDEAWAVLARDAVQTIIDNPGPEYEWNDPATKGLRLYQLGIRVAAAYDMCAPSESWDGAFNFKVSSALRDQGTLIIQNGGTEQSADQSSNWQGARGSAGVVCLLASDHPVDPSLIDSGHNRVMRYLDSNMGTGSDTRGWNPEGLGYFGYPVGDFVGPFGIAMARHDSSRDIRNHTAFSRSFANTMINISQALNVLDYGAMKLDWVDDHTHVRGNGAFNLGFYYLPDELKSAYKYQYDRIQGHLAPDRARWDELRTGPIWAILYYPEDLVESHPMDNGEWMAHLADSGSQGIGLFTFRNNFSGPSDHLIQFNAKTRHPGGHNGPDGLGIRAVAAGNPFISGGGRGSPGRIEGQSSLYPAHPQNDTYAVNGDTGTLVGHLQKVTGDGHVIGRFALSNLGVFNHQRWFITDFDKAATGTDVTMVIADTSDNGEYFQLTTWAENTVNLSGNTFTVTAPNGAVMQGTVLTPGNPTLSTDLIARGSGTAFEDIFNLTHGGRITDEDPITNPGIRQNRVIRVQGDGSGDFLVVLTVQAAGAHPVPSRISGTAGDAVVQVGSRKYTLLPDNVLYDNATYTMPLAQVAFDPGAGGTIASGNANQSIAPGNAAVAPEIAVLPGYIFKGWDRPFDHVFRSMTVTALYDAIQTIPTAPSGLTAKAISGSRVQLIWLDRSIGELGFEVEGREVGQPAFALVGSTAAGVTSLEVSGLTPLTSYEYRVRAQGTGGPSPWSAVAGVTTLEPNAEPVFESLPVTQAYQGVSYRYTVSFSDADGDNLSAAATTLPGWLSFTVIGGGQAVLEGIPAREHAGSNPVVLEINDGINGSVSQSFAIHVTTGPQIAMLTPTRDVLMLPDADHGIWLEAMVAEPANLNWVQWQEVGTSGAVTFDDASSLSTGATFAAEGVYHLRISVSEDVAINSHDIEIRVGVPLPGDSLQAVRFGGAGYVTSNQKFADGAYLTQLDDLDGDGASDDVRVGWPMTLTETLSPRSNYDESQPSARIYGGIVGESLNTSTGNFGNREISDRDPDDRFYLRYQPGTTAEALLKGVVLWKKEDFLNGTDQRFIGLDGESELSVGGNTAFAGSTRWVVMAAGKLYASQSQISPSDPVSQTLSGSLLVNELWAPYNPAGWDLDFDQSQPFTVSTSQLQDIQAIGLLVDMDTRAPLGSNPKLLLQFEAFSATVAAGTPLNSGPVISLSGAPHAGTTSGANNLFASVSDDNLSGGSVATRWSVFDGPGSVTFSDAQALVTQASFSSPGSYTLRLYADDGEVITFRSQAWEITGSASPLDQWLTLHFGSPSNPNADLLLDPNHNGLINLVEFILDRDPWSDNQQQRFVLAVSEWSSPVLELYHRDGNISFPEVHQGTVDGIQITVEWSTDLLNWQSAQGDFSEAALPEFLPSGLWKRTLHFTPLVPARLFFRVNITAP